MKRLSGIIGPQKVAHTTPPVTSDRHFSKFAKLPKMPTPTDLGRILLARSFACPTHWWASWFYYNDGKSSLNTHTEFVQTTRAVTAETKVNSSFDQFCFQMKKIDTFSKKCGGKIPTTKRGEIEMSTKFHFIANNK